MTDHSGENLYEGSRHRIRWTASSSTHMESRKGLAHQEEVDVIISS